MTYHSQQVAGGHVYSMKDIPGDALYVGGGKNMAYGPMITANPVSAPGWKALHKMCVR